MTIGPEQVANELSGLAKRIYDSKIIDTEQRLTITWDALNGMGWNLRGAGWYGDAHLIRSSSFYFANPTENIPQETTETNQQFLIESQELFGTVGFTKDFLTKLLGGVTSFADYTYKLEDLQRSMKKNQNQALYIGPTMARTTLTSSPSGATTATVASTQYLFIGMYIDIYNSTTLQVSNVQITGISGLTLTFGTAITATSGWTIYLHDEFLNAGTGKGYASLPQICDDGTDFNATFENISRTTYPGWRGNRINAAGAALSNDLLQRGQNTLMENSGHDFMTENYKSFVHLDSVRRYLAIILPQKRYVDASNYDSGMEKPNMLEWNGRPLVVDPDCIKTDWYFINMTHVGKAEIAPLGQESMFGGGSMKWKNGYMQGVTLYYSSGNAGTDKPNSNVVIRNLAAV